jgi:hypothetical protein
VYRFSWDRRAPGGPVPATALDHPFGGVVAVASADAVWLATWAAGVVGDDVPLVVGFARERVVLAERDVADHALALAFCRRDPGRVPLPAEAGFASAFVPTVPGTDAYVDDL